MATLTSNKKYWPLTLGSLAIFAVIFLVISLIWQRNAFIFGFFFVFLFISVLIRKIIREITFDGSRIEITYMQWGFPHTASLGATDVLVDVVEGNNRGNVPYQYLKITDGNHRLLYQVRTGDGFELEDLKTFAAAFHREA